MREILTIDGASGTGKGTVAKIIAKQKKWNLLDSGIIYRALAFKAQQNNVNDEDSIVQLALKLDLTFGKYILLDNINIEKILRTEDIAAFASKLAVFSKVRKALLELQRGFAVGKGLVADGRDMGTVVFPQAKYKVFLTANTKIRALRRAKELQLTNESGKIDKILQSMDKRDKRDKTRGISALIPAKDAVIIDTSDSSVKVVVDKINELIFN